MRLKSNFGRHVLNRLRYMRISTKITCFYALVMAFVLLLTGILANIGIYFTFYHQAELELNYSMKQVEKIVENGTVGRNFWQQLSTVPGVILRVTDITGTTVYQNADQFPSNEEVEAHTLSHPPFWSNHNMQVVEFDNVILYHATMTMEYQKQLYQLHFFRLITAERYFLTALQKILIIMTIIGFLVALFVGYLTSRRILKPIRDMIETSKQIEIRQMGERIALPVAHDELYELAVTLNHMLDRLERGVNQQRQFVSDASHELRTPVTVILGYSDLLSRWGSKDEQILQEGIESIQSEAENMQQLIEKLLFLARADQQRQVLHKENVDLYEIVDDVYRKMKLVTKDHTVTLLANEHGMIYADIVMMRQMMRIVLENSTKYTPKGGHITISSTCDLQQGVMKLELADDGIGIAKENQQKIFERFYRADVSRTKARGVSGTGLGLSIARWIASQHHIRIDLVSDLGKGSKFIFTIPMLKMLPEAQEQDAETVPTEKQ